MTSRRGKSMVPFAVAGLAVALFIGVVVSNFAASTPDAMQRAVLNSECSDAADQEACLTEAEGAPVLEIAPSAILGYSVNWLSGLVGVLLTFVIGAGMVFFLRRGNSGSSGGASRRVR